jgi:hypothetical protein
LVFDTQVAGDTQQFAFVAFKTGQTVGRMVGDSQFHDPAPNPLDLFAFRDHDHPFLDGGCACGG